MNIEQIEYFKNRIYQIEDQLFERIEEKVPKEDWLHTKQEVTKIILDAADRAVFGLVGAYTTLKELEAIVIEVPQEEKEK